ncbi:Aminotransferase class I and II [Chitinophaga costaii]|uniref:Aminotransferase class I and II n=1 Tax=Chitinophaga costaii TaxID=1335309 RepID=A0A1C4F2D1_9BACT|nr:PLP-dependent aminotransferase family protein [Chitinophaga costaii]PUZ22130.1 PLP-dependent aminotransferase family protein [Chitinophaga costaii]SCC49976.1 Aminotransferase class I and II [Chitinophaga costaii]
MLNLRLNYPSVRLEMDVFQRYVATLPDPQKYALLQPPYPCPSPAEAAIVAHWLQLPALTWHTMSNMIALPSANSSLFCILSCFQSYAPGIAVEEVTFPGFRMIASHYGYPLAPIACDQEGMIPEALQACLQKGVCKMVYLQPTVQNPTGAVMSLERRQQIAEIVASFPGVYLLEDDAYRFLHPDPPPTFLQLLPARTIHVYGLSKPFNPFLKSAYIVYPKDTLAGIEKVVQISTSSPCALFHNFGLHLMQGDELKTIIREKQREGLRWHQRVAEALYNLEYTLFPGSFHIWLYLGETITGSQLSAYLATQGIALPPGTDFSVTGADHHTRIALGAEWANAALMPALEQIAAIVRTGILPG